MKVISFKELIDLEPKPKILKSWNVWFEYDENEKDYYKKNNKEDLLTDYFKISDMNDLMIEIIEEQEEDKPIEQLNLFYNDNHKEYTLEDIKDKGACSIVTERATHILVIKINEIIDQLNELKKVGSK